MASLLTVPAKLYPRAISELMVGSATQVAFYGLQTSVTWAIPTPWVACMQRQGCTGVGVGDGMGWTDGQTRHSEECRLEAANGRLEHAVEL